MKLNNTLTMKRKSGMTLLELTVVILVLLSLISILFVGARAWKKGSDRSANIMNVRNVQQAIRGHQNTRGLESTDTVVLADIFTSADGSVQGYLKTPKVPVVGTGFPALYTYGATFGDPGVLFVTNSDLGQGDGEYFYTAADLTAKTGDW